MASKNSGLDLSFTPAHTNVPSLHRNHAWHNLLIINQVLADSIVYHYVSVPAQPTVAALAIQYLSHYN